VVEVTMDVQSWVAENTKFRPRLLARVYRSIGTSPVEFPAARIGRLSIRLQIRTGFTGPWSNGRRRRYLRRGDA
jgi:hypothetical protein